LADKADNAGTGSSQVEPGNHLDIATSTGRRGGEFSGSPGADNHSAAPIRPPDTPSIEEPAPPPPAGVLGLPRRGWRGTRRFFWAVIPKSSTLRGRGLQLLVASRFMSESSQQMITYAALIAIGASSSLKASMVMVATLLPQAMFGLVGGAIADWFPRRLALMVGYSLQAAICFSLPFVVGDTLFGVLGLIFLVYAVAQVSAPAEASIVPQVVEESQLVSANSWISFAVVAGSVFGTVIVAPILVKLLDIKPVFVFAGILFTLAALRLVALRIGKPKTVDPLKLERQADFATVFRWLRDHRQAFLMLSLGVLAGAANFAMVMLAPRYTVEVLDVEDPSNAVYIFWTSGFGLLLGLLLGPGLVRALGAWTTAVGGFVLITVSLFFLGIIDGSVDLMNSISLIGVYKLGFLPVSDRLAGASLLALPLGFGITIATLSAQTFLNATVPENMQGRVFSIYLVLRNGSAVLPLLAMGLVAEVTGVQVVTALAPFLLLGLAIYAARLHSRWSQRQDAPLATA
jgi:MFS family permease